MSDGAPSSQRSDRRELELMMGVAVEDYLEWWRAEEPRLIAAGLFCADCGDPPCVCVEPTTKGDT